MPARAACAWLIANAGCATQLSSACAWLIANARHQDYRLDVARLLRIDVWMLQIRSVCMREFIQGQNQQQCGQNIALSVLGKMSTRRLLLNYMQSERFSDRLKTELRGNKSGLPSPQPLFMNFPVAIAFAADTLDPTTLNQNFNRTFHCAA